MPGCLGHNPSYVVIVSCVARVFVFAFGVGVACPSAVMAKC
ncbi:hypothetical protein M6B38_115615 [Iris pallida]|uniref:Uncharacterized protein n=1 Tax=Iris pallida TaxID=29817 RepID=A0AAX6I4P3_IRIPA|nr:hypothetical protein M6B38_115615 [Iris pallida]